MEGFWAEGLERMLIRRDDMWPGIKRARLTDRIDKAVAAVGGELSSTASLGWWQTCAQVALHCTFHLEPTTSYRFGVAGLASAL